MKENKFAGHIEKDVS